MATRGVSLTIGVTTHNEARTIGLLLDALTRCNEVGYPVIIYDDASDDSTVALIEQHPLSFSPTFRLHSAKINHGGPSIGRQFIADTASTEYVTLIDGDDRLDPDALFAAISEIPPGADMAITPYSLRGSMQTLDAPAGILEITNATISRLISGIGGRIYRRTLLKNSICHEMVGRSEDARSNILALLALEKPIILHVPDHCFYYIDASRKSLSARQIRIDEIYWRRHKYRQLAEIYGLDDNYMYAVKRNFLRAVEGDPTIGPIHRLTLRRSVENAIPLRLKRIVLLCNDASALGGVPSRIRMTLSASRNSDIDYQILSLSNTNKLSDNRVLVLDDTPQGLDAAASLWRGYDTVVITQNNILRRFPIDLRRKISNLPLIYFGDAQLSFMLQDAGILSDRKYPESFFASKIISLSDADISFQRQLGIHGQVKCRLPVEQRTLNPYNPETPITLGYVGVSDFRAKATDRLVDLALALKEAGLPAIQVYTTDAKNSPDFEAFVNLVNENGVSDHIAIHVGISDKDAIYTSFNVLVVPSKKESFGNVILEAFSFGVPAIACSYAPGPAELITQGETGFLMEDFSGAGLVEILKAMTTEERARMSHNAFERHKLYTPDQYLSFLEREAQDTLNRFDGRNKTRVFPDLPNPHAELILKLRDRISVLEKRLDDRKANHELRKTLLTARNADLAALRSEHRQLKKEVEHLLRAAGKADTSAPEGARRRTVKRRTKGMTFLRFLMRLVPRRRA